jgi:uncharacterized membrane protein
MNYPFHPMLVHFPIALLVMSVVFDAAGQIWKRESFQESGFCLHLIGLIGGAAAAFVGHLAEEAAEEAGIAESLIERHETLALTTLGIFFFLFVWRLLLRNKFTGQMIRVYFFVATIGLGTLAATGHFGGNLVFEHGAGVQIASEDQTSVAKRSLDD